MFPPGETSYPRILLLTGPILATLFIAASAGPVPSSLATPPLQKAREAERYGKIPLTFEANQGQADKSVKFLTRGSGYGVYLTRHEAALILCKPVYGTSRADFHGNVSPVGKSAVFDVLHMQLAGANSTVEPIGEERLPGKVNYFVGSDPTRWHAGIPTYAKVRYTSIYPGVDLIFHGNPSADGQLEFDFVIAPNGDPRAVRLRLSESNHLHLAANGDLLVATANGTLVFRKPLAYQVVDGKRHPIAGNFARVGRHAVRFQVGRYDRTKPLVIDPALAFSTFLGSSGATSVALIGGGANAIAVDSEGNAYLTGQVYSTNFPVTAGAFETTDPGAENQAPAAFVTKLNATGTALVYSTYLGGSNYDQGSAIAVDPAGNAYVAGQTTSTNFPVTAGALQTANKSAESVPITGFVAKLNSSGTNLIYSTYLGGSGIDGATAIAVDAAGEAYVVGQTSSSDFPVTQGAYQTTNKAAPAQTSNAFIAKLNSAGTALIYATYLGGSGGPRMAEGGCLSAGAAPNGILGWPLGNNEDGAFAVAVDAAGEAYVTGQALSTDFPVTPGAFQTQSNGAKNQATNAFVAKLNPAGSELLYSTYLGGSGLHSCGAEGVSASGGDTALALAVDSSGDAYLAGIAFSSDFPVTQGAFQTTNRFSYKGDGGPTAFVAKLNPSGSELVYSTYLGGSGGFINFTPFFAQYGGDQASGLAIDGSGNAYVTGSTASANFPVTPGAYQTTNNYPGTGGNSCPEGTNGYNAFVTEINPTGSALVYSTYLGGNGANPNVESGQHVCGIGDASNALALDNSGNVYIAGQAQSADFPVTSGAFQTTNPAFISPFVAELNMSATSTATTPTVTVTPASTTITSGRPLSVTVSVSGGSGDPTPTGTVTLVSGTYASSPTTLTAGSATINIPAGSLPAESAGNLSGDELTANYVPDKASSSTYDSSTGTATVYAVWPSISVTPSSTTLTWAQAQSQALPVAIGVTAGTGNPVPTGTVTLTTGSWSSAATALSGGSATITIPPATLTTGYNTLNVNYSGDSNYARASGQATVTVTGPPGFTITGTAVTVTPGVTTGNTSTIAVTPANGFTGNVTLTAALTSGPAGAQDPPTFSFGSTSPVTITGTAAGTATLTIATTAPNNCGNVAYQTPRGVFWYTGGGTALALVLLFGVPARRRRWRTALAMLALLVTLMGGWLACGGGRSVQNCGPIIPGTTPGSYTITVTGTSGAITATGPVTLTVQ
jgi:hypothetical protein